MIALGCCCCRSRVRIIFMASTSRLVLIPPAVDPAQAHTIEPKISRMTANEVHWLESAVANPVVVTTDTNWKSPWRKADVKAG